MDKEPTNQRTAHATRLWDQRYLFIQKTMWCTHISARNLFFKTKLPFDHFFQRATIGKSSISFQMCVKCNHNPWSWFDLRERYPRRWNFEGIPTHLTQISLRRVTKWKSRSLFWFSVLERKRYNTKPRDQWFSKQKYFVFSNKCIVDPWRGSALFFFQKNKLPWRSETKTDAKIDHLKNMCCVQKHALWTHGSALLFFQ